MDEHRKRAEQRTCRGKKTEKEQNSEKKKPSFKLLISLICICVVAYAGISLITGNVRLKELQKTEAAKKAELKENEIEIKELEKIKKSGNTDEYVIKVAREKLGLAFSDEKVYKVGD